MTTEEKYKCPLDEQALRVAMEELNEDPSTRHIEVKTLRQRLEKYPGLRARTDTVFLLRFLRARKFDQELTFQLILNYYTTRRDDREVFKDLKPICVRHVFESGYTTPLGIRDRKGASVVLEKPGKWDYSRFSELDLIKADCITIRKITEEETTQVYGITLIIDYTGFTLSHLAHTSPSFARRMCRLWQDVFPARLKAVHIVNEPASYGNIFGLFKPFLKQKLLDRIFFHGTRYSSLHEHIDPELLPESFGGTKQNVTDTDWCDVILKYDKQFEEDAKFGLLDMNVTSGQGAESESAGGVAKDGLVGTFKKLAVD
ncbi:alpha-tocopherol transfer protein-like [Physella acuta]|uniref:alpha-tocopherol transfer protein-like n=1 Tax=Physella acuta TaxID=109671 RepID=UPI0027DBFFF1|nr:alpha-tocopherol transfer protein-like [Physella acuta]